MLKHSLGAFSFGKMTLGPNERDTSSITYCGRSLASFAPFRGGVVDPLLQFYFFSYDFFNHFFYLLVYIFISRLFAWLLIKNGSSMDGRSRPRSYKLRPRSIADYICFARPRLVKVNVSSPNHQKVLLGAYVFLSFCFQQFPHTEKSVLI